MWSFSFCTGIRNIPSEEIRYICVLPNERMRTGQKFVKDTAKISLILPDGSEFQGKKKEIDLKIEEIIGLDVNQFTQIAMIAQGDFLKLLHAESKERMQIFSKIFHTRIFWKIQDTLKEQAKELYIQLEKKQHGLQAGNGTGADCTE